MQTAVTLSFALLTVSLISSPQAVAQDQLPGLKVGDSAVPWENLPGTDGEKHSMVDLAEYSVVVVCFTSNTCPYSIDYEDRLIALQKKFRDAGTSAVLIAINSNAVAADSLEKMKDRANEKKFNFQYLRDDDQSVARAWGALFTPEFFVLNQDRKIIYRGALDDVTEAAEVKVRYVELAVDAGLRGQAPEVTSVPARGCAVRYKKERRQKPPN